MKRATVLGGARFISLGWEFGLALHERRPKMMKLSNSMKNAALATVLGAGLIGATAVSFAPVAAHAQWDRDRDDRVVRDRDVRFHRDWDDRYYHRYWNGRTWVGIGVPGFGIGFYDTPAYDTYYASPYCSDYDYEYGYCTY
jgi:hypothetical protein